jgi:tRNA-specific 2-thiouridylase
MNLGAEYVATGHYCRKGVKLQDGKFLTNLLSGKDSNKDQSYFLCQLDQNQLSKVLFPIGHLTKPEVRKIAKEIALPNADKKDSQGLCFIGKVKLPVFLQQQLLPKKGRIIEIVNWNQSPFSSSEIDILSASYNFYPEMGNVIGEHEGAHYYTVGQRKGLGVGGREIPLFIVETDTKENIVYVAEGEDHGALNRKGLFIPKQDIHWLNPTETMEIGEVRRYDSRIRYRQPLVSASLHMTSDGLHLIFDELQKGIARGQFAVWYEGDRLVGSGVIS